MQEMCDDFKRGALIDQPASETGSDTQAAIAILNQALKLDGRAGTKIKDKIEQALTLLGEI
ncbi:hypothetical protein NON20_26080 (plasmid) [Synechocystis sp. B12]|nr:hypothetical protein NON20_26105 [Synechocystis sp. B12]WLT40662.1 hypothetical protein NON20_26080 [Synechocystis sp. B12]